MPRDSRIAYIISQLGELRELLLVIEQSGNAAPGILLKLAKEKTEEIARATRDLRPLHFWEELQNRNPFTENTAAPEEAIDTPSDSPEKPEEEFTTPEKTEEPETEEDTAEMPVAPEIDTPEQEESEAEKAASYNNEPSEVTNDEGEESIDESEPAEEGHENEEEEEEEDTLYPWEKLSDEERSIAQNDKEDDFDIESEEEEEEMEEYDENDIYEDSEESAGANNPDETASTVTLEEALQRQQAKELRKALSLNDRFRFRRELFGNSDIRMNETLALIDAMNSYEEAEDYILNDLNWDEENTEVAEFMKIVQKHFL